MDHILNSGPQSFLQAEGLLISTDADIAELSDHRPIWAQYTHTRKSQQGGKAERLRLLRTALTLKDRAKVQRYQDIMSEKFSAANLEHMEPVEIIRHLSKLSYDAVQEAQPDKKHRPGFRSPYKDGWSPEAIAYKIHLRALIEIRRHVFGYHKRRKWTTNNRHYSHDIRRIVTVWRDEVIGNSKQIQNT